MMFIPKNRTGKKWRFGQLHFIAWPFPVTPKYSIVLESIIIYCVQYWIHPHAIKFFYLFVPLQLFGPESTQKYHVPNLDGYNYEIDQK